jgi:dUTP pyrophosphatase
LYWLWKYISGFFHKCCKRKKELLYFVCQIRRLGLLQERNTMSARLKVPVHLEQEFKDFPLPQYATQYSAGVDLYAATRSDIILKPGQRRLISTGIRVAIPTGFEGQVRPRSGLALKYGVTLLNAPGTIDSDYRGIVGVILVNLGEEPFTIHRGDRIAQLVIAPVQQCHFEEVDSLKPSTRGTGGFGSTGFSWPVKHPKSSETETDFPDDTYSQENDATLTGSEKE